MPPPEEELRARVSKLAKALEATGFEAALLRHPLNIFYLTGFFVDGHLVVTKEGEPHLLVYRTMGRPEKSPLVAPRPFRSLKELPRFLEDLSIKRLALEEDRLPVNIYARYRKLLASFELGDVGPLLRKLRAIKSAYEISCLKEAARMLSEALEAFLPRLRPGMTELEAAGLFEAELRRRGHPAYTRTYGFGQELAYGHFLSGVSAVVPSYVTTGQGGAGVFGFPQGPSFKEIRPDEPILIDYAGWYEGYMVDQSRLFYFGELPQEAVSLYEKVSILLRELEGLLRPGVSARQIYETALSLAEELGLSSCFMAHGPERVPFVGHGVGLEIDEWPPIAGVDVPLEEGMVVALEPKCHVPDLGVIGIEDTYL
ncbi:MAG: aminopeptidase P family protein, partial [Thermodesulfobacteria bacterium]|nr:aminopeptidase P family protein [Thermodesulfobacteriota bacterium]